VTPAGKAALGGQGGGMYNPVHLQRTTRNSRWPQSGKAKDYDTAVAWVRTARDIYLQHNRGAEWQAYLAGLLEVHARKYKLVPMLRGIR
jgi:hypothetical protein